MQFLTGFGLTHRSATLPSTNVLVAGSTPIDPEQYTIPWHLIA